MNCVYDNGNVKLFNCDALNLPLEDESVDCVVTSPPYWGLRDYGTASWVDGDEQCDHIEVMNFSEKSKKQASNVGSYSKQYDDVCKLCGARREDDQIGLEKTPEEFVETMVNVFREVRRVLKSTGTVWLNLGDSYIGGGRGFEWVESGTIQGNHIDAGVKYGKPTGKVEGLKSKDLAGIPWRVALALQSDGWYLRSDIIWSKPNPMPESVKDRPTKAHEYIFLLTKKSKYYYDADAIREPHTSDKVPNNNSFNNSHEPADITDGPEDEEHEGKYKDTDYGGSGSGFNGHSGSYKADGQPLNHPLGKNKRSVWEVNTQGYSEAHFATFPEKLIEPCILAGSSEKGVCSKCGNPWEKVEVVVNRPDREPRLNMLNVIPGRDTPTKLNSKDMTSVEKEVTGWKPTCDCNADVQPAVVMDPFVGSGTTVAVAQKHKRSGIGIELNPDYIKLASRRIEKAQPRMI